MCVDCSSGRVRLLQPRTLPSFKKVFAPKPDGTGTDSFGARPQFSVGRERISARVLDFDCHRAVNPVRSDPTDLGHRGRCMLMDQTLSGFGGKRDACVITNGAYLILRGHLHHGHVSWSGTFL
jgi:hypothetical protein